MSLIYPNHPLICANFKGHGFEESDVIAVSSSDVVKEFEIKISRSDFKADFKKKRKHDQLENPAKYRRECIPNKFYYVCPEGLIKPEEVPEYAGLIYVVPTKYLGRDDFTITYAKQAKYIHKEKPVPKLITAVMRATTAKMIFGKAYMTWYNDQFRVLSHKEYDEYVSLKYRNRIVSNEEWELVIEYKKAKLLEREKNGNTAPYSEKEVV